MKVPRKSSRVGCCTSFILSCEQYSKRRVTPHASHVTKLRICVTDLLHRLIRPPTGRYFKELRGKIPRAGYLDHPLLEIRRTSQIATRGMLGVAEVTVDRPFIFFIRNIETGTILFLGRVTDLP